jgi:deazaflavin-dependent oxidoreductase (nitroreductase family)
VSDWNTAVIKEFRANGGKVAQFGDAPLVILNTIGARSGTIREIPLVALIEGDEITVFASAAGSPKHPDWFHNLVAQPQIDVEYLSERFAATVEQLDDEAAAAKLATQATLMPQFGEYVKSAAPRVIPAFSITRR